MTIGSKSAHLGLVLPLTVSCGIALNQLPGLSEERLLADSGVHRAGVKLRQILVQNLKPLDRVIISIEPDARIARVVEPPMEVLRKVKSRLGPKKKKIKECDSCSRSSRVQK